MINLAEYKKALGEDLLAELSEEQVLKLRDQHDQMSEAFFAKWHSEELLVNKEKII